MIVTNLDTHLTHSKSPFIEPLNVTLTNPVRSKRDWKSSDAFMLLMKTIFPLGFVRISKVLRTSSLRTSFDVTLTRMTSNDDFAYDAVRRVNFLG